MIIFLSCRKQIFFNARAFLRVRMRIITYKWNRKLGKCFTFQTEVKFSYRRINIMPIKVITISNLYFSWVQYLPHFLFFDENSCFKNLTIFVRMWSEIFVLETYVLKTLGLKNDVQLKSIFYFRVWKLHQFVLLYPQ